MGGVRLIRGAFAVLCLIILSSALADMNSDNQEREEARAVAEEPRMPRPGDKLGYSKEESTRRLDPEIRQLLDALLRLYREPGLFADRRAALAVLGVERVERRWHSRYNNMPDKEPTHFEDVFGNQGIFARPGWGGRYLYGGWRQKGQEWYADVGAAVDRNVECIDSRAVEGYLDLFLQTGLGGRVVSPPPELWDRHGAFGSPYALAISPLTPHLGMAFGKGCLLNIGVYKGFDYREVDDERVIN